MLPETEGRTQLVNNIGSFFNQFFILDYLFIVTSHNECIIFAF